MIDWLQNWDSCLPITVHTPWFGQMSLPRELSIKNGRLFQKPVCELGTMRRSHSYSITQASEKNRSWLEFEASGKFQERLKIWHRIEEKKGKLKEPHRPEKADSARFFAMELQMYFTAFVANIKRMTKLIALSG